MSVRAEDWRALQDWCERAGLSEAPCVLADMARSGALDRLAADATRVWQQHDARRTCGSLLADLDVHPRVAMQILRHANFKITMEIYTQVTDQQTRDALKRLGESLG